MQSLQTVSVAPVTEKLPAHPVERIDAANLPYDAFLADYMRKNRPVVVENAAAHWPAVGKWTPEYFKTAFADRKVQVSFTEKMGFPDFIDGVLASSEAQPGPYMFRFFIGVHMPELLADLEPANPYSFPRRYASPWMPKPWRRPDGYLKLLIGGVGSGFPFMHYDLENMHASITEIYGDKEFILYAPEDSPYLYQKPNLPNKTQVVNIDTPDLNQYPLLRKATQFRTVVHPGDMAFIPAGWWHTARVLTPSISVCCNQMDASNWGGFVEEICAPTPGQHPLKQVAKRAVLTGLNGALSALEAINKRQPDRPTSVSQLAPFWPKQAIPSPDWPVGRWRVRGELEN